MSVKTGKIAWWSEGWNNSGEAGDSLRAFWWNDKWNWEFCLLNNLAQGQPIYGGHLLQPQACRLDCIETAQDSWVPIQYLNISSEGVPITLAQREFITNCLLHIFESINTQSQAIMTTLYKLCHCHSLRWPGVAQVIKIQYTCLLQN